MYLHLGQDVVVPASSILGVYDMDTATWSKHTRALIASMEKAGRVQSIFEDLPCTFPSFRQRLCCAEASRARRNNPLDWILL